MDEHRSAQSILQRALARGTRSRASRRSPPRSIPPQLERALAHVASCEECSLRFDVADTAAWLESREETHAMAQAPVDPAALFESALTAALSDPDDLTRRRAAERLGEMTELGAAAVHALVAAAGEDRDERVRAAALTAVQRLDRTSLAPPVGHRRLVGGARWRRAPISPTSSPASPPPPAPPPRSASRV